jgi:hypothetical protein
MPIDHDQSGLGAHILREIASEGAEGTPPEPRRPARAEVAQEATGFSIRLPARGLRAARSWLIFAVVCLVLPAALLLSCINSGWETTEGEAIPRWLPVPFMMAFWSGALFLVYRSIHLATERTIIDVVDGTLLVTTATAVRKRQRAWRRAELSSLSIDRAPFGEQDERFWQLTIRSRDGQRFSLLPGMPREELMWIAIEIDRALKT